MLAAFGVETANAPPQPMLLGALAMAVARPIDRAVSTRVAPGIGTISPGSNASEASVAAAMAVGWRFWPNRNAPLLSILPLLIRAALTSEVVLGRVLLRTLAEREPELRACR